MFARTSTLLLSLFALASTVSAVDVLGLSILSPSILQPGNSLINLNVLADVLSPRSCDKNSVLGVTSRISLLNLLNVCACVNVIGGTPTSSSQKACPACPANASQICANGAGTCGCECNSGYYAATVNGKEVCIKNDNCTAPNVLQALGNGKTACQCARGYLDDYEGGCISACVYLQGLGQ